MKTLKLIKNDPWLAPYKQAIEGRHNRAVEKISELTGGTGNLSDFADGYLYFGLHKENGHWVFREWAPNANAIYLIGNFSNWKERPEYRLLAIGRGVWEIKLPLDTLHHLDFYKLSLHWPGGQGEGDSHQNLPATDLRMSHRYGATGRKSWQLYRI